MNKSRYLSQALQNKLHMGHHTQPAINRTRVSEYSQDGYMRGFRDIERSTCCGRDDR